MAIVVLIINEEYEVISKIGLIETDEFEKIITIAEHLNMKCLSLADYVGDTFFNEKQMAVIRKEIAILKKEENIDQNALKVIEHAIDEGLKDVFLYLKFVGE
jgi:hypothetical protein